MILLIWISSITGCQRGADSDEISMPPAYEYEIPAEANAIFDQEVIEQAMADLVDEVLDLTGHPALEGYDLAMELADETCPAWYEWEGEIFWKGSCYTRAGAWFHGQGFFYAYQEEDLHGDGSTFTGPMVSGTATIRDPDGHSYDMGGFVYTGVGTTNSGDIMSLSHVGGSFASEWPVATSTWLAKPVSPHLMIQATDSSENDMHIISLDGEVASLSDAATALELHQVQMQEGENGDTCTLQPAGTISVRDHLGIWWDVEFPAQLPASDEACNGCGTVKYNEETVGNACGDFSSLLDWEYAPW